MICVWSSICSLTAVKIATIIERFLVIVAPVYELRKQKQTISMILLLSTEKKKCTKFKVFTIISAGTTTIPAWK